MHTTSLKSRATARRRTGSRVLAAGLVACAAIASGSACAGESRSVEVTGQRALRTDVQAVCPAVHEALPEALAGAWQRSRTPATLQVSFSVDRDAVRDVRTSAGPGRYRRPLVDAVRELDCRSDREGPQRFVLVVRFAGPDAVVSQDGRLATLALAPSR